jgi:hypothetical protein
MSNDAPGGKVPSYRPVNIQQFELDSSTRMDKIENIDGSA